MPIHHPLGFKQHPLEDAGRIIMDVVFTVQTIHQTFEWDLIPTDPVKSKLRDRAIRYSGLGLGVREKWVIRPLEISWKRLFHHHTQNIHLGCSIGSACSLSAVSFGTSANLSRVLVGRGVGENPMRQKCILDFRRTRTWVFAKIGVPPNHQF